MKHLFVSISVKQNLFVSVFVHKCLMMLNDVEYTTFKMFVTQMNNYRFVISFQLMFYKTLRYRLARPLTVTRLRYNFILVSKLISEKAYCVKDNVVLQGLCPSSNCLYTKSTEIHDVTALERRSWIQISRIKMAKKLRLKLLWLLIVKLT